MRALTVAAFVVCSLASNSALAQTIDRITDSGTIKLGVRVDAAPYSYKNSAGVPAGYSVDLCLALAGDLKRQLGLDNLEVEFVPVGAEDRFAAVKNGEIDLLCGATTATLSRRELVDFSIPTFIDGASVMNLATAPGTFDELAGHKIGVRAGTTTEQALSNTLSDLGIVAEVIPVTSHDDGLKLVEDEEITAYFADQAILLFMAARSQRAPELRIAKQFFTYEPYALALTRGDDDFRLAVDRALSHIYKSGRVIKIFQENFIFGQPSDVLKALFLVSAMPE